MALKPVYIVDPVDSHTKLLLRDYQIILVDGSLPSGPLIWPEAQITHYVDFYFYSGLSTVAMDWDQVNRCWFGTDGTGNTAKIVYEGHPDWDYNETPTPKGWQIQLNDYIQQSRTLGQKGGRADDIYGGWPAGSYSGGITVYN
jgi:hypothetical protein